MTAEKTTPTTDFYQNHYESYFKRTVSINPSSFLLPFVKALPQNSSILDIGCGSGRDLLWLKKQGFYLTGFDQSQGLVRLAARHSRCEVIAGDFETYDFSPFSYDAILAAGSLVHVPHARLAAVIQNIRKALESCGIFYVSLKQGQGTRTDAFGRIFYLWQEHDLAEIFSRLNFSVLKTSNTKSVLNSKDPWLGFVLRAMERNNYPI